eukprot:GHVU01040921.1.p2 GENE.GHVU01040921.1~~GHVU01040921.1.p2  ORF type:complete len:245 (-),score=9.74 GHVU01040921.1:210-944(-)
MPPRYGPVGRVIRATPSLKVAATAAADRRGNERGFGAAGRAIEAAIAAKSSTFRALLRTGNAAVYLVVDSPSRGGDGGRLGLHHQRDRRAGLITARPPVAAASAAAEPGASNSCRGAFVSFLSPLAVNLAAEPPPPGGFSLAQPTPAHPGASRVRCAISTAIRVGDDTVRLRDPVLQQQMEYGRWYERCGQVPARIRGSPVSVTVYIAYSCCCLHICALLPTFTGRKRAVLARPGPAARGGSCP